MKFSEEFRDKDLVRELARRLARITGGPASIMEVCGTHTMSVARFGLKTLLPEGVRLISGPGCPVCVTAPKDLDAFLALGSLPGLILTSFGDMLKVPGTHTTLEKIRAEGAEVRVVYSPLDAVDLARQTPDRHVVFFGVGFETTMPATALAIKVAAQAGLTNFSVYCVHKTMPVALRALLASGELKISGLLLPGHVTTIIGAAAYDFLPAEFNLPCAVAGFEPLDILLGVEAILQQLSEGSARVDNVYTRAVQTPANPRAQALLSEIFTPTDARWRGLGIIPASGAEIHKTYSAFDATRRFAQVIDAVPEPKPSACRCGEVLRGLLPPPDCPLFGKPCTPGQPLGPCMVSQEGACAAAFRYS